MIYAIVKGNDGMWVTKGDSSGDEHSFHVKDHAHIEASVSNKFVKNSWRDDRNFERVRIWDEIKEIMEERGMEV